MVHETALTSSFEGKLLGINLNSKLKKHMTDICNKVRLFLKTQRVTTQKNHPKTRPSYRNKTNLVGTLHKKDNTKWVGQICLIPSKGELFLGQTIIKVEPNKVKWVMEFTPPTFRYGGA